MITKKQFCEHIVNDFCETNCVRKEKLTDAHCTQSSSLAVAMEFLGLIKSKSIKEYTETRSGDFITHYDNGIFVFLTVRELIKMLPESRSE